MGTPSLARLEAGVMRRLGLSRDALRSGLQVSGAVDGHGKRACSRCQGTLSNLRDHWLSSLAAPLEPVVAQGFQLGRHQSDHPAEPGLCQRPPLPPPRSAPAAGRSRLVGAASGAQPTSGLECAVPAGQRAGPDLCPGHLLRVPAAHARWVSHAAGRWGRTDGQQPICSCKNRTEALSSKQERTSTLWAAPRCSTCGCAS